MKPEKEALPAFFFHLVALLQLNCGTSATPATWTHDDRTIQ